MTLNEGDIQEYDDVQISVYDESNPPSGACGDPLSLVFLSIVSCPNDRSNETRNETC